MLNDAKAVIGNLWGESEINKAIEEFQLVIKKDGSDLDSQWSELLEEPHSRGCIKVVYSVCFNFLCYIVVYEIAWMPCSVKFRFY